MADEAEAKIEGYECPHCSGMMIHASQHKPKIRRKVYVCLNCGHEIDDSSEITPISDDQSGDE